jgi:hypothetical protein
MNNMKKMASDKKVSTKQRRVMEYLRAEKIDFHQRLLNVYGDQTVDVCTVRRWMARFGSGKNDVRDTACTTVSSAQLSSAQLSSARLAYPRMCGPQLAQSCQHNFQRTESDFQLRTKLLGHY